jgi:hypothetical protein
MNLNFHLKKTQTACFYRFDGNGTAELVKNKLDNSDIYAGCCTIKIDYAKVNIDLNMRESS